MNLKMETRNRCSAQLLGDRKYLHSKPRTRLPSGPCAIETEKFEDPKTRLYSLQGILLKRCSKQVSGQDQNALLSDNLMSDSICANVGESVSLQSSLRRDSAGSAMRGPTRNFSELYPCTASRHLFGHPVIDSAIPKLTR